MRFHGSQGGTLRGAWTDLPAEVRSAFWRGANLYVMVIGGSNEPG
jgi:hypothetical protein